jgi:hypothetical protein
MARRSASILLAVFIAAVSIVSLIEGGHELLHTFKNPLHYHSAKHRVNDHALRDHLHFSKMKFAHEMEASVSTGNFISLSFVFFQDTNHALLVLTEDVHATAYPHIADQLSPHPPTPPPLAIIMHPVYA